MIDNLEYYKVFYYVAKTESLTQAAGLLSISQPAVSQSIRLLEKQCGARLFTRVSRGVKLTAEGELLYSYVAKGYEQIEAGQLKLKQMLNLELGEIHIGASDMTLQFFLLPFLERFHEEYPKIKVVVTNAPTPETLQNLRTGQIDFGIVSTPFTSTPDFHTFTVRSIEDTFVCGRRFISYKNRTLDFTELQTLPIIYLEKNTSTRSYMDSFLLANDISIQPEFELATSDMIVQFALRNLGVGCVVRDFALPYLQSGKLFELRFNKIIPKREFCIVTHVKSPMSVAAKNLLDIIQQDLPVKESKGDENNDNNHNI